MNIKIRYLSHEIAKYFQSSTREETIIFRDTQKYKDLLEELEKKIERGQGDKSVLDNFVMICNGQRLSDLKNEPLNSNYEIIIAHADTGG